MPNLGDIVNDPRLLDESVERMLQPSAGRSEVRINHGIRTVADLEQRIAQAPADPVDVEAYRRLLGVAETDA